MRFAGSWTSAISALQVACPVVPPRDQVRLPAGRARDFKITRWGSPWRRPQDGEAIVYIDQMVVRVMERMLEKETDIAPRAADCDASGP